MLCFKMLFDSSLPPAGHTTRLGTLAGSADALWLAECAQTLARPLAVLTTNARTAQRLLEELRFFAPTLRVLRLPDWETLPYDHFSPHQDLVSERLATLYQLLQHAFDIVLLPVSTALQRLSPTAYLAGASFNWQVGDSVDGEQLRAQLQAAGYQAVSQVFAPGEYSIRGNLIDVFPTGSPVPYRLDLCDTTLESLRTFEVESQRSLEKVSAVRLLPAREFPLDESGQQCFRQNFRRQFEGDPSKSALYKAVSSSQAPAGIEYWLPLFFQETASIFDYLPPNCILCLHEPLQTSIEQFWQETESRYRLLSGDAQRPLLPPTALFLRAEEFFAHCKPYARFELAHPQAEDKLLVSQALPSVAVDRHAENPLTHLQAFQQQFSGKILLCAESAGRRETLSQYCQAYGLIPEMVNDWASLHTTCFGITHGWLEQGFILPAQRLAVVTENDLYTHLAQQRRQRRRRTTNPDALLRDLSEVKVGDPVVHEQHGIGRYQGLVNLDLGEGETEFLLLEYANEDKLYVPVAQLQLISRYSGGDPQQAPLQRLGSGQWEKAKRKAAKQVRDTAAELLALYAKRAARAGHACQLNWQDYQTFADGFGFEETPDQAAAIAAVISDLCAGKPMDRLVCGDVGFGKTEVALRAAFVAVMDGRQVAVLVPTTLLAEQHYQNFCDRFADLPVKIAELSRFRSTKEIQTALKGLAQGQVDIVIGTHRLSQKDVQFQNLGLVIIDEEHRFGVRQKEQLKALRSEVDILTLTATPIPRSLAMSLEGLRDFSVIATAPQRRLAVKTFVSAFSDGIIREAVHRELKRGGQVFFLHNEVETMLNMQEKLHDLLPEVRIGMAHGQMRERELEQVMRDFHQQRFQLLLCSTIIETGIDIPNANTMLINRADRFGLAQLHQLRGRVGRSHHQAYAYLLTNNESQTPQAKKRLEAIQRMDDLGSGFYLAMHDLEIRGAGEILGDAQSGEMQTVGFSLYTDMLKHAVKSLQQGKEPDIDAPLGVTVDINLHTPALLPHNYCPDTHERLLLYKRLANAEEVDALLALQEEIIDRFGTLPEATRALLACHRLRLRCQPLGIAKLDATRQSATLHFIPCPPLDPVRLIQLVQQQRHWKLSGADKLRLNYSTQDINEQLARLESELNLLSQTRSLN